jgi:hypothetical protein
MTCRIAPLSPSCASETTSFAPASPLHQVAQEVGPEDLSLGRADVQADDPAPYFGGHRDDDYRGDQDDAAAPVHFGRWRRAAGKAIRR